VATGRLDNRLEFYRLNSHRIPCIAGAVVPEPVFTRGDYENDILQASYRAIASLDPEGILQDEFLNSRGAIARFGRGSIEIRVLDIQECPAADLAIVELVDATLRALTDGFWLGQAAQRSWPVAPLAELFISCLNTAENTPIPSAGYRALFGHAGDDLTAGELWQHLAQDLEKAGRLAPNPARDVLLSKGTLASRILAALPAKPRREDILALYSRLANHLDAGTMFHG
jgi:hypothetical protein